MATVREKRPDSALSLPHTVKRARQADESVPPDTFVDHEIPMEHSHAPTSPLLIGRGLGSAPSGRSTAAANPKGETRPGGVATTSNNRSSRDDAALADGIQTPWAGPHGSEDGSKAGANAATPLSEDEDICVMATAPTSVKQQSETSALEQSTPVSAKSRRHSTGGTAAAPTAPRPSATLLPAGKPAKVSILDKLKASPVARTVACPACAGLVRLCSLNHHLDYECQSLRKTSCSSPPAPPAVAERTQAKGKENDSAWISAFSNLRPLRYDDGCCPTCFVRAPCLGSESEQTLRSVLEAQRPSLSLQPPEPVTAEDAAAAADPLGGMVMVEPQTAILQYYQQQGSSYGGRMQAGFWQSQKKASPSALATPASAPESPERPAGRYYHRNFLRVLTEVVADKAYMSTVFSDEEQHIFDAFLGLSENEQRLFIRLYYRKNGWFRVSKLDYPEIASIAGATASLVKAGFCLDETDASLQDALDMLNNDELKALCVKLHVHDSGNSTRSLRLEALHRFCQSQRTLTVEDPFARLLRSAKALLGSCVRPVQAVRVLFKRVHVLFFLAMSMDELAFPTLLFTERGRLVFPKYELSAESPVFLFREQLAMYVEFLQMEKDIVEIQLGGGTLEDAKPMFDAAFEFLNRILALPTTASSSLPLDCDRWGSLLHRPAFLKVFHPATVCVRIMSLWTEMLERKKRFADAVQLLKQLLAQSHFCIDQRGKWYDRLALDLERHMAQPTEALQVCEKALLDPLVRTGHLLAIRNRATRLCASKNHPQLRHRLAEFRRVELFPAESVQVLALEVETEPEPQRDKKKRREQLRQQRKRASSLFASGSTGRPEGPEGSEGPEDESLAVLCDRGNTEQDMIDVSDLSNSGSLDMDACIPSEVAADAGNEDPANEPENSDGDGSGSGSLSTRRGSTGRVIYLSQSGDGLCNVEQIALDHYARTEGLRGVHGENGVVTTLFGLLMWDIIFHGSVPSVFQTRFQYCPLDLMTDGFFEHRKSLVLHRVHMLSLDPGLAKELVALHYDSHYGEACLGVQWTAYSRSDLVQMAECLGGRVLGGICDILARDFRHRSGGLPDLLLWNADARVAKFAEVKSTNDSLSHKQHVWIHVLQRLGASVDVCRVRSLGGRSGHP